MLISYTLRLTNNSITFLSTFLDKGKDNIWNEEKIDILYKIDGDTKPFAYHFIASEFSTIVT